MKPRATWKRYAHTARVDDRSGRKGPVYRAAVNGQSVWVWQEAKGKWLWGTTRARIGTGTPLDVVRGEASRKWAAQEFATSYAEGTLTT